MYKACMFDLDGTLANTLNSIAFFGNTALKEFGFKPIKAEKYKLMVGNGADKLIRRMLKNSAGEYSEEDVVKVRTKYDSLYEGDPLYLVTQYDGVKSMLTKLKELGIKVSVLSNKPDDMTNEVVKKLYSTDYFTVIRGQKQGVPTKPDPTAPLSILGEIGILPKDCLYIGDSGVDMQTGTNAGMITAGVTWGFRSEEELIENGAVHICNNIEQLMKIIKNT